MPTLNQIANQAGVSRHTVANVLNGRFEPRRSDAVKRAAEIRRIAERLNYRPHAGARATVRGRFGQIAMLTRHEIDAIQLNLNKGAFAAASENDLLLSYAELHFERLTDPDYAPKVLSELCADGFLIHYAWDVPPSAFERIRAYQLPTVWINTRAEHNCVYPDDRQGARLATEQLLETGRRDIVYVPEWRHGSPPPYVGDHYSRADRESGYTEAMTHSGQTPRTIKPLNCRQGDSSEMVQGWRDWLEAHKPVDAVICYSPTEANAISIAAISLGLRLQSDLVVCCFHHNHELSGYAAQPAIIQIPMRDVGHEAVGMLEYLVQNPESDPVASQAVPYRPIESLGL